MRLRFLLAIVVVVLVGCVPESRPTETPDATASPATASPSAASATPDASVSIEPTTEPVATPTPSASASPSGATPSESVGPGSAAACSGSDKNRSFFMDAAKALPWTVYCAVLPSGWFVDSGEYRRAGGGRLEITYRGPGSARFELHEGAFCTAADGCVPGGVEVGAAQLGDQSGRLIATDTGGWALVVDGDGTISWLAVGSGMDENAFRGLAAAVVAVSG